MSIRVISVARDFSRFPAGRHRDDGPYSGELFRDNTLCPALTQESKVIVELDGTLGYGSSFLEEAFGGLVREGKVTKEVLHRKLELRSSDDSLTMEIWSYIDNARPARARR